MSLYVPYVCRSPQRPEEDVKSPGTEVIGSCDVSCEYRQPNSGLLQGH